MNRFLTLLLAASCLTAVGQVEFPWNPDTNDDGIVGAEDLLGLLSVYNGEWELPDPTLWATSTINALLEFQAELDSVNSIIQDAQANITSGLATLDSLVSIEVCNDYHLASQGGACGIYYGGNGDNNFYDIPNSCRVVNVITYYYGGVADSRYLVLPEQGLFEGQTIEFTLNTRTNLYQPGPFPSTGTIVIKRQSDEGLVEVGGLTYNNCNMQSCGAEYIFDDYSNEKFVWLSGVWTHVPYVVHEILVSTAE